LLTRADLLRYSNTIDPSIQERAQDRAQDVLATMNAINEALPPNSQWACRTTSWDDVERGTSGGTLSCWGNNITDTRLYAKDQRQLFTVRSENLNEQIGCVSADEVAIVSGNQTPDGALAPITLRDFLRRAGELGSYAGLPEGTDLSDDAMDSKVSIRFQTTFLPVDDAELGALEFAPEVYSYQTQSNSDPKNLLLLATTQGVALQASGRGATKLFHHQLDAAGSICRHYFEAERSTKTVGGAQVETEQEAVAAAERGKATAAVIGTRAMGTRFNVLMTVQIPLEQKPKCSTLRPAIDSQSIDLSSPQYSSLASWYYVDPSSGHSLFRGAGASLTGVGAQDDGEDYCDTSVLPSLSTTQPTKKPRVGASNAARVSLGSFVDKWRGLQIAAPRRDRTQHCTVTVVIYNTVAGGVPSVQDVKAAVDDMEKLYRNCQLTGSLAGPEFNFMKRPLNPLVTGGSTFPTTKTPRA
jgi:huntingtin